MTPLHWLGCRFRADALVTDAPAHVAPGIAAGGSPWTGALGPLLAVEPSSPAARVDEALSTTPPFDAVLVAVDALDAAAACAERSPLRRLASRAPTVVVLGAGADRSLLPLFVRAGAQDVLTADEAAHPERCATALRLACERHALLVDARRAFSTDLATGLPNEAQFREHLTHLVALRAREPATMAVLAIEIDGTRDAAARLGAEAARVLQRKVAVRLRACLRASDVVAAWGDDRFTVLLAWLHDVGAVDAVVDKVRESLGRPYLVAGQAFRFARRVGVARFPDDAGDAAALVQRAWAAALGATSTAAGAADAPPRVGRASDAAND